MSLRDKGVVVTGGGNGIGRALAVRAAADGARVVVNDIDADAADAVAREVGGIALPADLATETGATQLVEAAIETLGGIDVFFGNAGIDAGAGEHVDDRNWEKAIDVNLMAHVRASRALVPHWLERGSGHFVVTASAAGLLTMIGNAPYSVTKHATVAFAEWLSIEYGNRGVRVQVACPQGVNTRMLRLSGAVQELLSHDDALEPADVADTIVAAMDDGQFLILPHPEFAGYYAARAADTDRWLAGMRRLHERTFTR
ncbi:SDR family oxidoreductase [Rhodococcus zopfii]|uniref:SDR family oxidoreductase n=1 Tax=Rhodococcus zopfii TaxID=43772 RepID=UPI0035291CC3